MKFLSPFFIFLGKTSFLIRIFKKCLFVKFNSFEFAIVNIPIHAKSFSTYLLHLIFKISQRNKTPFSILVHDIFAKTCIKSLHSISYDKILSKTTFNMTISIKTASFIVSYNILTGKNITITQINSIILTIPDYIIFKSTNRPCKNY